MKKICQETRDNLITDFSVNKLPAAEKAHFDGCDVCQRWLRNCEKLDAYWSRAARDIPDESAIDAARRNAMRRIKIGNGKPAWSLWLHDRMSRKFAWGVTLAVVVFGAGIYVGILMRRLPPDTVRSAGRAIPHWILKAVQSESSKLPGNVQTANLGLPELLAYLVKYDQNAGHRMNSVEELANMGDDQTAQQALIYALKTDKNPGIRMKAIKSLAVHPINRALQDAYIYALWNDENPGIRLEAIDALTPVAMDRKVMETLQFVASVDKHEGVRAHAREAIRHAEIG